MLINCVAYQDGRKLADLDIEEYGESLLAVTEARRADSRTARRPASADFSSVGDGAQYLFGQGTRHGK